MKLTLRSRGIKKKKDENGKPLDGIAFHPYYTVKDIFGVGVFLIFFLGVVFFAPDGGGYFLEKPNFIPADPLVTPEHITPAWSFGATAEEADALLALVSGK